MILLDIQAHFCLWQMVDGLTSDGNFTFFAKMSSFDVMKIMFCLKANVRRHLHYRTYSSPRSHYLAFPVCSRWRCLIGNQFSFYTQIIHILPYNHSGISTIKKNVELYLKVYRNVGKNMTGIIKIYLMKSLQNQLIKKNSRIIMKPFET